MPDIRDFGGQIFALSALDGDTDWRNGLVARVGRYTLELELPAPGGVLRFAEELDGIYGDCFTAGQTRGALLDAHNLIIEGEVQIAQLPPEYHREKHGIRTVISVADYLDPRAFRVDLDAIFAARKKWVIEHCPFADRAGQRAVSQLKTMLSSPCGILPGVWTTPDRWPHRNMWLWDSAFHAVGLRHLDPGLAQAAIRAVFAVQDKNSGFIPHFASPEGKSEVIQPPVLGYGVDKILEIDDDVDFLRESYIGNKKFLDYCVQNRDPDNTGLLEYRVEDRANCHCAESGMDNSPRFDHATRLSAVDFNAFYARECQLMAKFARRLDLSAEAESWQRRADMVNELINKKLWDEKSGFYCDFDVKAGRQVNLLTSAGFLPLLSGAPSPRQAERMVELLHDRQKFGTALPVPSLARDSEAFSTDMWRGPVWVNINVLISEGLKSYGYGELAAEISAKTFAAVEKYFQQYGTFFEYYDADDTLPPPQLLRKGNNDPDSVFHQPLRDFGWTAALYLDYRYCQAGKK